MGTTFKARVNDEIYFLPDGTQASDVQSWANAWALLAKPIEEVTGFQLRAFDPAFQFVSIPTGQVFELPTNVVKALHDALVAKDG